jgi:hypothetical protein
MTLAPKGRFPVATPCSPSKDEGTAGKLISQVATCPGPNDANMSAVLTTGSIYCATVFKMTRGHRGECQCQEEENEPSVGASHL